MCLRDRRRPFANCEFVDIFKKVHLFGQVFSQLGVSFDPLEVSCFASLRQS